MQSEIGGIEQKKDSVMLPCDGQRTCDSGVGNGNEEAQVQQKSTRGTGRETKPGQCRTILQQPVQTLRACTTQRHRRGRQREHRQPLHGDLLAFGIAAQGKLIEADEWSTGATRVRRRGQST